VAACSEGKTNGLDVQTAFVNKDAKVIKPNLYISKGLVHVIDGVLTPAAADTKAAAAPAAAVATEAGAKKAPTAAGRRLLNRGGGGSGLGGNSGRAGGVNQYAPTIALDSSEQAIWAAVNGATNAGAVQKAAAGNVANALVLTHFKEDATYADGISDGLRGTGAALGGGGN
jgi:hypothetical protein